jgi:hypothetical protein
VTEFINRTQNEIINRAAARSILKQNREAFRKYVADILRGKNEPTNADVRHACGSGTLKYGRKL